MHIRRAEIPDASAVTDLALLLWPENDPQSLLADMLACIGGADSAVFLAEEAGGPVAFAQCQLRHDYVEGTNRRPVGYLEGIYVREPHRRTGVARALLAACVEWSRSHGCTQFASDCELDNTQSIAFHLGAGFQEANRLVCFVKDIL